MPFESPSSSTEDLQKKTACSNGHSTMDDSKVSDDKEHASGGSNDRDAAQLKKIVSTLKSRIQRVGSDVLAPEEGQVCYLSDDEHDLDEGFDDEWASSFVVPSNVSMRRLQETCRRIVENVRCCLAHKKKSEAKGKGPGVDYRRLRRIALQLDLIGADLDDFTSDCTPVLRELSGILDLSTLIHLLSGKGVERVAGDQVRDEINAGQLLSHYRGFSHYREEDLRSLKSHGVQMDLHLTNWELLTPYFRAYCRETETLTPLAERDWYDVKMPVEELAVWNRSMRELVGAAERMLPLCSATLRNLEKAVGRYRNTRKTVKFNLSCFLNLNVAKLFDKEILGI